MLTRDRQDRRELDALQQVSGRWATAVLLAIVIGVSLALLASTLVLSGDWDLWVDWKDRVWWAVLVPSSSTMFLSAALYMGWRLLRIPSATMVALMTFALLWIDRAFLGFHVFAGFPLNFVWPGMILAGALLLDAAFVVTRSWLATSVTAMAAGFLFYPANFPALAPFLQPVVRDGRMLTVGNLQGLEYVRSSSPEYLRVVDVGSLHTFAGG